MIQASPEQVREITRAVLKRPEFHEDEAASWIARTLEAFFTWLQKVSKWAGAHPDSAKILISILGIVLVALLLHITYTVISEFLSLRKRNERAEQRHGGLPALEGVADNWNDAFVLARAALQSGDLYRGIWITHRILLSVLDLRHLVRFTRWKTNTDYIRECSGADPAAATLREISDAYERIIYAHGDFDRERAAGLVDRVEALASREAQ